MLPQRVRVYGSRIPSSWELSLEAQCIPFCSLNRGGLDGQRRQIGVHIEIAAG
jgi:hypothetical protein